MSARSDLSNASTVQCLSELRAARDDHAAEGIAADVGGAGQSRGEQLGDRGLAGGHGTGDHHDATSLTEW